MNQEVHLKSTFQLQSQPGALFVCFASRHIYGYALSQEQTNNITISDFSQLKGVSK